MLVITSTGLVHAEVGFFTKFPRCLVCSPGCGSNVKRNAVGRILTLGWDLLLDAPVLICFGSFKLLLASQQKSERLVQLPSTES